MFSRMDALRPGNVRERRKKKTRYTMTLSKIIMRALLAFVAIAILQMVAGMIVPMKPVAIPHLALWMLVTLAITVAALAPLAARTEWQGWRLGAAVSAIPLAIFSINLIEALVF